MEDLKAWLDLQSGKQTNKSTTSTRSGILSSKQHHDLSLQTYPSLPPCRPLYQTQKTTFHQNQAAVKRPACRSPVYVLCVYIVIITVGMEYRARLEIQRRRPCGKNFSGGWYFITMCSDIHFSRFSDRNCITRILLPCLFYVCIGCMSCPTSL